MLVKANINGWSMHPLVLSVLLCCNINGWSMHPLVLFVLLCCSRLCLWMSCDPTAPWHRQTVLNISIHIYIYIYMCVCVYIYMNRYAFSLVSYSRIHVSMRVSVLTSNPWATLSRHAAYRDFNQCLTEYPLSSVCSYDSFVLRVS